MDSTAKDDKKATVIPDVCPRLSIYDLMKQEKQWHLFVQGYAAMQNLPPTDVRSFYQVAGIHGLPFVPYDGVKGDWTPDDGRWGGYCHHGMQTFPTWHRAYVHLIESIVRELAMEIAQQFPDNKLWIEAAKKLRFPYWDWASRETEINGMPEVFTDKTIDVYTPDSPTTKTSVTNPIRAFTLAEDTGNVAQCGDFGNPSQKPNYVPIGSKTPYTPKGYATIRHPTRRYTMDVDALNLSVQRYTSCVLRPGIFQVFTVNNYEHFSNHSSVFRGGTKIQEVSAYGHFASLEVVHDAVHDAVGGNGGHMSYPDVAGFDPIFFLHHCNVDRLLALWQAMYPSEWVTPFKIPKNGGTFTIPSDSTVDANSPLTPFRKSKGSNKFWTSNDVRETRALGYYYPELEQTPDPEIFRKKVLDLYRPDNYTQLRWFINFPDIKKRQAGGPFSIRVFLDDPKAKASTPTANIHFAGSITVFARDSDTQCANCMVNQHMKGSIELTRCMYNLGILVPREPGSADEPIDENNPPGSPLSNSAIRIVVATPDNKDLSDQIAGPWNITWAMELDTKQRDALKPKHSALVAFAESKSTGLAPVMIGGLTKSK